MATRSRRLMLGLLISVISVLVTATSHFQGHRVKRHQLGDDFVINIATDGTYSIQIRNTTWLNNAPTFVRMFNQTHTAEGGSLKLMETDAGSGTDGIGAYQNTIFRYQVTGPAGPVKFMAMIKVYPALPVMTFSQIYSGGADECQAKSIEGITGGFPGFKVEGPTDTLGFLSYGGMMFGDTGKHIGQWYNGTIGINDGIGGGPLALFDVDGRTLIISPFNNFMSASFSYDEGNFYGGVMGGVSQIPGYYDQTFIMYYGTGINKAFDGWGQLMRKFYGKDPAEQTRDMTVTHLGYWTDNGAFYYYNTEEKKNYEQTMIDAKAYADSQDIPYKYLQYDSWWYYKGIDHGVKTWVARPDIFPDGFSFVTNKTRLPAGAHNRYWAADTTYAKQNGGKYDFIVEKTKALPLTEEFWLDLFSEAKKWGLILYEQDWLNVEFGGLDALLHNLTLGTTWLQQMGDAAVSRGLHIQYCMSNSRHAMQALTIPAVTQARASDDYSPGKSQWKIGISSIFAAAMGVAPYKDTFWTTEYQTGNPYHRREPNWMLNTVVSVLSTGPVGPSDKIGNTNVPVLMKCCNNDGLILKPGHPARAIDGQIIKSAFSSSAGPTGEVWVAYSDISAIRFANLLLLDLKNGTQYTMYPKDLGVFENVSELTLDALISRQVADGMLYAVPYDSPLQWTKFTSTHGLTFTDKFTPTRICLYHMSVGIQGWNETAILGNLDKWVPMSPQRVTSIVVNGDTIRTDLKGSDSEVFSFWYILHGFLKAIQCKLSDKGVATFTIHGANETATCMNETAIFGNLDKWVPMSPQRVTSIVVNGDTIRTDLKGSDSEVLSFWYILHGFLKAIQCKLSDKGVATFTIHGANETATCM